MPNTVVVTGGSGFIGSNFIRHILIQRRDCRIINLDALTYAGNLESLADISEEASYRFVQGDICDRTLIDRLFAAEQPSAVIHFAAESHVDRSIDGPDAFVRTNVNGTFTLLEATRKWLRELAPERRGVCKINCVNFLCNKIQ